MLDWGNQTKRRYDKRLFYFEFWRAVNYAIEIRLNSPITAVVEIHIIAAEIEGVNTFPNSRLFLPSNIDKSAEFIFSP